MPTQPASGLAELEDRAGEAAQFLRDLANPHRLAVLCRLSSEAERSVGALAREIGLSQSALSQHLARLRQDGLVTFRREGQTLYYRLADARAGRVLSVLNELFCPAGQP